MESLAANLEQRENDAATAAQCPVCESLDYRRVRRRGGIQFGYCGACGAAYVHPFQMDEHPSAQGSKTSRTAEWYANSLYSFDAGRMSSSETLVQHRLAIYTEMLGRKPETTLEVGCATGIFCKPFEARGVRWTGIDIHPEFVRFANDHGVPAQKRDFLDIASEQTFDVLYASQVLEHFLQPREFMHKAREVLAPGGLLHVEVPNHNGLTSLVRRANPWCDEFGFLQPPHHLIAYTAAALRRLLIDSGFEPLRIVVCANDHPVFGQLLSPANAAVKVMYRVSSFLHRGSLLVALARRKD